MGEKRPYWFCVLSGSNTEDRKTRQQSGVGSGAATSPAFQPQRDEERKLRKRSNARLPGVMHLSSSIHHFFLLFCCYCESKQIPVYGNWRQTAKTDTESGSSSSSSSIRPVTPSCWQRSQDDLLFHETPSCSLLSCHHILLLAGSMQERGTMMVCFITFIPLLCQPGKGERRGQTFSVFIVTLDD